MIAALSKAFAQLTDPAFRSVMLRTLAFSIAAFCAVWFCAWWGLTWAESALADWLASESWWAGIVGWLFSALSVAAILVASFLLFPAVTAIILSFLLDDIAEAVERRHYPALPQARQPPLFETLRGALGFAGVAILLNLIALPLYLVLTFLPPANLFVFYMLNGYLLGREYFELVAVRRLELPLSKALRRRFRVRVFVAGVAIAFLLSVPVVNLIAPIVATGFMVHIFEALRQRGEATEGLATR